MAYITLAQAASQYLSTLSGTAQKQAGGEVTRFVRWYGSDRSPADLRGHDISLYGDFLGAATVETSRRIEPVKAFLTYLKKVDLTNANLAPHLRLRKAATEMTATAPQAQSIELTPEGYEALKADLASLIAQRPVIAEELRRAMMDKDFRENAPLDAIKDKQAHLEARIKEIETGFKHAVIVHNQKGTAKVQLGSTVVLRDLASGGTVRYTIVGLHEANAQEKKISSMSPVGRALLEKAEGQEIEVAVPAGTLRFRVEQIEG